MEIKTGKEIMNDCQDCTVDLTEKFVSLDNVKKLKEELIEDYLNDKGCQLEGYIAKLIIEYDKDLDGHDMAFFIMKGLNKTFKEKVKNETSRKG